MLTLMLVGGILWNSRSRDAFIHPVQLKAGFAFERRFHVSTIAVYRIEVRFSRVMPFRQMKELLEKGNLLEVRLLRDGSPAEMHHFPGSVSTALPATLGFAKQWISQDVATFKGDPKAVYRIACSVTKAIEELNAANPTLLVTLDPIELKRRAITSLLLDAMLFLCATLFLLFGARFLSLRRQNRR